MVYYIFYKIRLKRILINQIIKQAPMSNENERVKSLALSHTTLLYFLIGSNTERLRGRGAGCRNGERVGGRDRAFKFTFLG